MFIKGISTKHIVNKIAQITRDYEVEFINTEYNKDTYTVKVFLRFINDEYRIRLLIVSDILSYPALDMIWIFGEKEYDLATRVFHRIADEVDYVKTHNDNHNIPASTLAAKVRESVKPISIKHQEKKNILWLDEVNKEAGVSDWRKSLYGNRFPNESSKEKNQIHYFQGKQE